MAFKTKMVKKRRVFLTKSGSVSHMSRKTVRKDQVAEEAPAEVESLEAWSPMTL